MRFLQILCLLLMISPLAHAARSLPEAKLMAVYFTADWCPNCKVLEPKYNQAILDGDLEKSDILFLRFDLTNKSTIYQAKLLAKSLGIGDYLTAQGSGTGYVAVLDAVTHSELMRFTSESSADEIRMFFQDHLH